MWLASGTLKTSYDSEQTIAVPLRLFHPPFGPWFAPICLKRPENCITGPGKRRECCTNVSDVYGLSYSGRCTARGRIRAMSLHITDTVRTAPRPLRAMRARTLPQLEKGERSAFKSEIKDLVHAFDTNLRLIYLYCNRAPSGLVSSTSPFHRALLPHWTSRMGPPASSLRRRSSLWVMPIPSSVSPAIFMQISFAFHVMVCIPLLRCSLGLVSASACPCSFFPFPLCNLFIYICNNVQ